MAYDLSAGVVSTSVGRAVSPIKEILTRQQCVVHDAALTRCVRTSLPNPYDWNVRSTYQHQKTLARYGQEVHCVGATPSVHVVCACCVDLSVVRCLREAGADTSRMMPSTDALVT